MGKVWKLEVMALNDDLYELLEEYCSSLKGVRHLKHKAQKNHKKHDASLISSMESDLEWTIEYMATGYMPTYSEGHYIKIVPVDPQKYFYGQINHRKA